jgi:hypothetical protein
LIRAVTVGNICGACFRWSVRRTTPSTREEGMCGFSGPLRERTGISAVWALRMSERVPRW